MRPRLAWACIVVAGLAAGGGLAQGLQVGPGAVGAGRDITNSRIEISGYTAAQVQGLIEQATAGWERLSGEQQRMIASLSQQLGVTNAALHAFFATLGEAAVPGELLAVRLLEISARYKELLGRLERSDAELPAAAALRQSAKAAIEAGKLDDADRLLAEIEHKQDEAIAGPLLRAAATRAERAELALTRLRYAEAAGHFAAAAARVPAGHDAVRLDYLDSEAAALYQQGKHRGDSHALAAAADRYRAMLQESPRERAPYDWAVTQNNLGVVLSERGEREAGTERLQEAAAAFHAALEVYGPAGRRQDVARTQNNLGTVLVSLGDREGDPQRYEAAAEAFRAALQERTREQAPLAWAMTQTNLGTALRKLSDSEDGTQRLQQAVEAFAAALEVYTRETAPVEWGAALNNLGVALRGMGQRAEGTAYLELALEVFRRALLERTRERYPLAWAATQNNLGNALVTLAGRESSPPRFAQAIAAYRAALEEFGAASFAIARAGIQTNLGDALLALGRMTDDADRLREAIAAYGEARRMHLGLAARSDRIARLDEKIAETEAALSRLAAK